MGGVSDSKQRIEKGLVLFGHTKEAFIAESALKKEGFVVRSVLPPRDIVTGCDVALEFNINERLAIERAMKEKGLKYMRIISVESGDREPLSLVKKVDFGDTVMYRCAAMKITVGKEDKKIVNISGGGCPDVPYLFIEMVGKRLKETKRPSEIGYSLCAYSLEKAYDQAMEDLEAGSRGNHTD